MRRQCTWKCQELRTFPWLSRSQEGESVGLLRIECLRRWHCWECKMILVTTIIAEDLWNNAYYMEMRLDGINPNSGLRMPKRKTLEMKWNTVHDYKAHRVKNHFEILFGCLQMFIPPIWLFGFCKPIALHSSLPVCLFVCHWVNANVFFNYSELLPTFTPPYQLLLQ